MNDTTDVHLRVELAFLLVYQGTRNADFVFANNRTQLSNEQKILFYYTSSYNACTVLTALHTLLIFVRTERDHDSRSNKEATRGDAAEKGARALQ